MNNHRQIWNQFCTTHNIATTKVPLFEASSGLAVKTKQIGKPTLKSILCRSLEMDNLIRAGMWVFNDMCYKKTSRMIESLNGSGAN
jgi:hypothetical protein